MSYSQMPNKEAYFLLEPYAVFLLPSETAGRSDSKLNRGAPAGSRWQCHAAAIETKVSVVFICTSTHSPRCCSLRPAK